MIENSYFFQKIILIFLVVLVTNGCSKQYYITHALKARVSYTSADAHSNEEYRRELESISNESQISRQEIFLVFKKYGFNSKEAEKANLNLTRLDSMLLMRFISLENKYGWPLKNNLKSSNALNGAFIAVDHSDPKIIEKYLPKFKIAQRVGESDPLFYPTLKDRLMISKNKKQIYGTQSGGRDLPDGTFEQYLLPVRNYKKLDKIRAKVGLDSILSELKEGTLVFK